MSSRGDREFLLDILEACIISFTKDMSYDEFVEDNKNIGCNVTKHRSNR